MRKPRFRLSNLLQAKEHWLTQNWNSVASHRACKFWNLNGLHPSTAATVSSPGTWRNHGKMSCGTYKGENWWKRPCCGKTWTRSKQNFRGRQLPIICGSENSDSQNSASFSGIYWSVNAGVYLCLDAPLVLEPDSHTAGGVTRKGPQGCCVKTSVTFSTFSFYTRSTTGGGAVNFALAITCS